MFINRTTLCEIVERNNETDKKKFHPLQDEVIFPHLFSLDGVFFVTRYIEHSLENHENLCLEWRRNTEKWAHLF